MESELESREGREPLNEQNDAEVRNIYSSNASPPLTFSFIALHYTSTSFNHRIQDIFLMDDAVRNDLATILLKYIHQLLTKRWMFALLAMLL